MPFTPFHFGPGAAIKACLPTRFSFTVFCFAQVATDVEVAYYMIKGMYPWHRFFHTYVGATVMGAICVGVGRPICELGLRIWSAWREAPFRKFFPVSPHIPLGSACAGAFIGTYSHVLLDSLVHEDLAPYLPFSSANPSYQAVSAFTMHAACVALGLFGTCWIVWRNRRTPLPDSSVS